MLEVLDHFVTHGGVLEARGAGGAGGANVGYMHATMLGNLVAAHALKYAKTLATVRASVTRYLLEPANLQADRSKGLLLEGFYVFEVVKGGVG